MYLCIYVSIYISRWCYVYIYTYTYTYLSLYLSLYIYTANSNDQKWWLRDVYIYEEGTRANTSSIENMNAFNASEVIV